MAMQRGHVFLAANAVVWLLGVWYVAMLRSSLIRDEDLARVREEKLSAALADAIATNRQAMAQLRLSCNGGGGAAAPAAAAAPGAACPPCPACDAGGAAALVAAAPAVGAGAGGDCTTSGHTFAPDGSFVLGMKLWKADPVTHMLSLPESIKRVWVDVGTHAQAGVTRPFLNTERDLFIIGFEPNHFQWGEIATSPDPSKTHDWGKGHPNFWAIHAAASEEDGYATFHRSSSNMCSSLNDMAGRMKGTDCGKVQEEFTVNVLALSEPHDPHSPRPPAPPPAGLHRPGPWLMWVWCGGRESVLSLVPADIRLEFVKIDAQVLPTSPLPRYHQRAVS